MPAHRKTHCGICGRPLAGDNLYIRPDGKGRACRHCRNGYNSHFKARELAAKRAAEAEETGTPADQFAAFAAAIRAELNPLSEAQREPYYRPPGHKRAITKAERAAGAFARRRVTIAEAAELTGLSASTLTQHHYAARSAHRHGTAHHATMPLPREDRTWATWQIALWRAALTREAFSNPGRWKTDYDDLLAQVRDLLERHNGIITLAEANRALGRSPSTQDGMVLRALREAGWDTGIIPDDQAVPAIEAVIAEHGRAITPETIREALAEAGVAGRHNVRARRVTRLIAEHGLKTVRPGTPDGPQPAVLESLRWDGLVTTPQVAEAYQCAASAVYQAVKDGRLTPALREGRRALFDPAKIAARRDGQPGPVDAGHELAVQTTAGSRPDAATR